MKAIPAINNGAWARTGRHEHQHSSGIIIRRQYEGNMYGTLGPWRIVGGPEDGRANYTLTYAQWLATRHLPAAPDA